MDVFGHMKYKPKYTTRIKKQIKLLEKHGYDMNLFKEAVGMLIDGNPLPAKYRDHPLRGDKRGYRGCHIQSDWVLIYKIEKDELILILSETGTHSNIFR